MKFHVVALFPFIATVARGATPSCLGSFETGVDYFPDKVQPIHSQLWDVEYHNYYKIVSNKASNMTYLLYQCGSQVPQLQMDFNDTIQIPVSGVAIASSPYLAYFEQLNLEDKIKAYLTSTDYIYSPCFLDRIKSGAVLTISNRGTNSGTMLDQNNNTINSSFFQSTVFFGSSPDSLFNHSVLINETQEKTNAAIFEWVKYISAFFNAEKIANEVVNTADNRSECVTKNADTIVTDMGHKPTVLWAYYSEYCSGWDVGQCPNYYCEFATDCHADLIWSAGGEYSQKCYANYMTTDQLVALGKDAEYWIYPDVNWNSTYYMFKDKLDTMKSVQNKEVYDLENKGIDAWFEQRFAQYYKVLQDFCNVVGTETSLMGRTWFHNVFTQPVHATSKVCTSATQSNILNDTFSCVLITKTAGSSADSISLFVSIITMMAATLFFF